MFSFFKITLYHDKNRSMVSYRLESFTSLWVNSKISNLEYLMLINQKWKVYGSDKYAPVIPWVTDFRISVIFTVITIVTIMIPPQQHGRLNKIKIQIEKGDDQLNTTYAWYAATPYAENLTDITYYVYLARVTPQKILQSVVRAQFNTNEYPNTIEKLYQWTPDECIVEMYTDPSIFQSIHDNMADLGVPEDTRVKTKNKYVTFIKKHRELLESDLYHRIYIIGRFEFWI